MKTLLDNATLYSRGDTLVLSCDDELALKNAIEFLEKDGAELVEQATWVSGNVCTATLLKPESRLLR